LLLILCLIGVLGGLEAPQAALYLAETLKVRAVVRLLCKGTIEGDVESGWRYRGPFIHKHLLK
jgi:hypothetical protein